MNIGSIPDKCFEWNDELCAVGERYEKFSVWLSGTVFYPKYSERHTCANSADPDQTPQNAASDLGLHSLPPI